MRVSARPGAVQGLGRREGGPSLCEWPRPPRFWAATTPASTGSQTTGPHRWGSQAPAAPERVGGMTNPLPWAQDAPQSWPPALPPPAREPRSSPATTETGHPPAATSDGPSSHHSSLVSRPQMFPYSEWGLDTSKDFRASSISKASQAGLKLHRWVAEAPDGP